MRTFAAERIPSDSKGTFAGGSALRQSKDHCGGMCVPRVFLGSFPKRCGQIARGTIRLGGSAFCSRVVPLRARGISERSHGISSGCQRAGPWQQKGLGNKMKPRREEKPNTTAPTWSICQSFATSGVTPTRVAPPEYLYYLMSLKTSALQAAVNSAAVSLPSASA